MRINKLIQIGRFEIYIGRRPHWSFAWEADRISHGWGLWAGHWELLACWLPKRKPYAQVQEELLAMSDADDPGAAFDTWSPYVSEPRGRTR